MPKNASPTHRAEPPFKFVRIDPITPFPREPLGRRFLETSVERDSVPSLKRADINRGTNDQDLSSLTVNSPDCFTPIHPTGPSESQVAGPPCPAVNACPGTPSPIDRTEEPVPAESSSRSPQPTLETGSSLLKVLHVVNGEHFSGAERVQSHLGRCLPKFGVQADFACVKPGRFLQMLDDQRGAWGQGFNLGMRHRGDLSVAIRLSRLVQAQHYDLLHAHTPRAAMLTAIAAKLTGRPWIYHVHSPASRDSERRWMNRLNAWVEQTSLRTVTHRITVSRSLRRDFIRSGADPETVTVVHNGVPALEASSATACRARLGPPPIDHRGHWTLGMVALMRPRKGLEVLLDAMAILRREGRPVVLQCIGPFESSQYEAEIESRIAGRRLESVVERVGFTRDVQGALQQLDALVLPSLYGEGLPMVVLEAMAVGLPVIATAVEGTPEAIRHGLEGLLAKPSDPVSLADSIRSLIQGDFDWNELSRAAVDRHRLRFSDWTMAEKTASVYRRVLAR